MVRTRIAATHFPFVHSSHCSHPLTHAWIQTNVRYRQEYPYCRLNKGQGQIEPPQPKGSVYLAPSPNSMGVLLLKTGKKQKSVTPNRAVRCLNLVYTPSSESSPAMPLATDPSGVGVAFETASQFVAEEKAGRVLDPNRLADPQ